MSPALVETIVGALLASAPEVLGIVERMVAHEKARRVEAVRPETGHAEEAAERLRAGKSAP